MGKSSVLVNLAVVLLPLSLGIFFLVASILGAFSSVMVAIATSTCGVALLVAAKLPAFRSGRWVSFGPRGLPSRSRVIYFLAWSIIWVALLLWISILLFVTA